MDQVTPVKYEESFSIKVGKWLLKKEYIPASHNGLVLYELTAQKSLGILKQDKATQLRKYLFGLITYQPRRSFLGTIWFDDKQLKADEENWIFEVYGREHADRMRSLADEMATIFQVKITVRLVREQPEVEARMSDYDY